MDSLSRPSPSSATNGKRVNYLLAGLAICFGVLAIVLGADLWGRIPERQKIPLVASEFLEKTPWRRSYADLVAAKEDLSDFDCYACHEKAKPPVIQFDANHRIIIPKEHANIAMGHGSHD